MDIAALLKAEGSTVIQYRPRMLDDIRDLYLKVLIEKYVKPEAGGNSPTEIEDVRSILYSSLLDFENRIQESNYGDPSGVENVYLRLSPFEAFKYRLRDTEAFIVTKYRERKSSRLTSSSGSSGDSECDLPVQALRQCHTDMVEGLQLKGTKLLNQLIQNNCLDDSDMDSIICRSTDRKQNEHFLHLMSTRLSADKILNYFLPALNSEHAHLANNFQKTLQDIQMNRPTPRQCPHCRMKGQVDPKCIAEMLYIKHIITENELKDYRTCPGWTDEKWNRILEKVQDCSILTEALKPKYPDFHQELAACGNIVNLRECTCWNPDIISIPCIDEFSVFDGTEKTIVNTIPAYPMTSSTQGICAIIHNTKNAQATQADNDVDKIATLFSGLGFNVERITNLTKRHMILRLEEIASRNHTSYDAFVCVIALGGTDRDHVCDVSGEAVHIAYIVAPFRARNCQTLAEKPKVFLLPCASGSKRAPGLVIKESVPGSPLESKKTVVPEDADILYARGTLPGYTMSSCKRTGSWYINNLLEVMDRHGDSLDFVSCLAMVNEGVGRVEYTKNDFTYTQTSHVTSTLRKALLFRRRPRSRSKSFPEEMEHIPSPQSDSSRL